jgi:hypothetical protein
MARQSRQQPKRVRIAVDVEPEVARGLKLIAANSGRSLTQIVRDYVQANRVAVRPTGGDFSGLVAKPGSSRRRRGSKG